MASLVPNLIGPWSEPGVSHQSSGYVTRGMRRVETRIRARPMRPVTRVRPECQVLTSLGVRVHPRALRLLGVSASSSRRGQSVGQAGRPLTGTGRSVLVGTQQYRRALSDDL